MEEHNEAKFRPGLAVTMLVLLAVGCSVIGGALLLIKLLVK
jgi:hypothetical protein